MCAMGSREEACLLHQLLTFCREAQFLTGHRLVLVHGPGHGPCLVYDTVLHNTHGDTQLKITATYGLRALVFLSHLAWES